MVSKASDDLPDPDRPVSTTSLSRGRSRSMFLRLCSRAPRMEMNFPAAGAAGAGAGRGIVLAIVEARGRWLSVEARQPAAGGERTSIYALRTPKQARQRCLSRCLWTAGGGTNRAGASVRGGFALVQNKP